MNTAEQAAKEINDTALLTIKPSKIHGVGVFALQAIKAGTILQCSTSGYYQVRYEGVNVLNLLYPSVREVIEQRHSCRSSFGHPNNDAQYQAFMNHSTTPNSTGRVALCDIAEGEEITENYAHIGAPVPVSC